MMTDLLRQEIAATATTIVVKVGTRVLTHEEGTLNEQRITQLAEELSSINETGRRVVLVSSGAVGAGMSQLGLKTRPTGLARLQAVAAIGQTNLIEMYDRTFRLHGRRAAQVLLTAEDLEDRSRYLNVRNTLLTLLEFNAIPIINENDTVSVDELMTTFGDNDRLAALVTNLLRAPLLIILSDVAGLYDGDPGDPKSSLIPTVPVVDETILAKACDGESGVSRGGMFSKLQAARIVSSAGETLIIASGKQPSVLRDIMAGRPVGTLFLPQGRSASPWKRWLRFSTQPRGRILLDPGACKAISHDGSSLLAIGITEAKGEFAKGDVVSLCGSGGAEFARGLTNYESGDIERIKGLKSDRIAEILGHCPYEEVVHRDNLAVF
ncbi:MAG: glutamate 5-kinase [Pirellulaceae bacterium]|jgi:glutamate 5-kinase|nr:glutamate 5-kinase [Pirellulaceae bacterium]